MTDNEEDFSHWGGRGLEGERERGGAWLVYDAYLGEFLREDSRGRGGRERGEGEGEWERGRGGRRVEYMTRTSASF